MAGALPPPVKIAEHYNTLMQSLEGEYIHSRWGDSEIKRRHYRQTETALRYALGEVAELGAVLEIGCGPAVWTPLFLGAAGSLHLLDISEEMLGKARERIVAWDGGGFAHKVRYTCADFCVTVPESAAYDTIVSARAFEYMADKQLFLRHCHQALRPGGRLLLITKNRGWKDMRPSGGARPVAEATDATELPVEQSMHLGLASWAETASRMTELGYHDVVVRPVVFGSYRRPWNSRLGLALSDLLHTVRFRRPIVAALDWLIESYIVIGTRPGL